MKSLSTAALLNSKLSPTTMALQLRDHILIFGLLLGSVSLQIFLQSSSGRVSKIHKFSFLLGEAFDVLSKTKPEDIGKHSL